MTTIEIVGHRGAKGETPENSTAGFLRAKSIGPPGVEFDVHASRDNQLVVIQDSTVDHAKDARGAVSDYSSGEFAPLGVPRLSKALHIISPARL